MSINNQKCAETRKFHGACEVQQHLAETSVLHSEIVWDVLGPDQSELLIKKLEYLFPDDKRVYTTKIDLRKANKYNKNVKQIRDKLFHNIWKQRKYTNGALLHSIFYIIFTPEMNVEEAKRSHNYSIHPVFRTKRCLNSNSSAGCCMIFIDEQSRIYQNWKDLVKNIELPKGIMIAPKDGYYALDNENKVILEYNLTPAYYRQALSMTDNLISVASIVSKVAAVCNPIFSVVAIGTQTYETVRNFQKMSDKVKKGTTTNLEAGLSFTSDIVSLTSSIATFGAYMRVRSGDKLSTGTGMTLQTINTAATIINSTKLIITIYDLFTKCYLDDEKLVFSDILAFSSSLLLFTNSVNNIAITAQLGKVKGNTLRSLLQTKIKAGLTLVSGEVLRLVDPNAGSFDLLRLANDIPYKDILCNMNSIYSNLTRSGFLITLSTLGAVAMEVTPGLIVNVVNKEITEFDFKELSKHFGLKFVQHIANSDNLTDVLNGIGMYFSATVVQFLLNQTRLFIETTVDKINLEQKCFITTEMILYKFFGFIIKNYKTYTYEFLEMRRDEILSGITNLFKYLDPITANKSATKYTCDVCGGYYYLVN